MEDKDNLYGDIVVGDYLKSNYSGLIVRLLEKDTGLFHGAFTGLIVEEGEGEDWEDWKGSTYDKFRIEAFSKLNDYKPSLDTEHSTDIEELKLSNLTFLALKRAGINTVEQLKNMSEEEILKIRNISNKRLLEIKSKIKALD